MQHKHYFAALLCGALCLTGCLKNEESASVASVRNAKANELNASAELLKAQAAAETTIANAEAAIKQAQAKLAEANAKKVEAEAEYQKVLNELKAVEVELQKVKVEEEKVELLKKQAELETILAQLEVVKAQAEKDLANIAKELQKIQNEMEQAAISQSLALLQAEAALKNYEVEQLNAAVAKYFQLQNNILNANIQINENLIKIAQLENMEEAAFEALLETIEEQSANIARWKAYVEKAEEYREYDQEEKEAMIDEINLILIDAYNYRAETYANYRDAYDEYDAAYEAISGYSGDYGFKYASYAEEGYDVDSFNYDTYDFDINVFNYLKTINPEIDKEFVQVDEDNDTWAYQLGFYNDDEWVPIHTYLYAEFVENVWFYPDGEETPEKLDSLGIAIPYEKGYSYVAAKYQFVPAQTDVEVANAIIDEYVADLKKELAEDKADAKKIADDLKETKQEELDALNARIDAMKDYIAEVGPKFDAANDDLEEAQDAYDAAEKAVEEAEAAVDIAKINDFELEEAVAALRTARQDYRAANRAHRAAERALDRAKSAKEDLEAEFMHEYDGSDMATAEFNRDKAIAVKTADVNAKKAAVTDAIVKAYTDAQAATAKAKDDKKAADKDVEDKLADKNEAELKHLADPDNTALTNAYNTAVTNYNNAVATQTTAQTNLTNAQTAEATAKTNFDNVNNPYKAAQTELKALTDKKEEWEEKFNGEEGVNTIYNAAVAEEEDAATALKDAADTLKAAEKAYDDAKDALAADEIEAWEDAQEELDEAEQALEDAQAAVSELRRTYRHYFPYVRATHEAEDDDDVDGWLIRRQKATEEVIADLITDYDGDGVEESYKDYIDGLDDAFKAEEEKAEEVKAVIKKYDEQYRPAYVEGVKATTEARDAYIEAYLEYRYAQAIVTFLVGEKSMLVDITFYDENGRLVNVDEYINNLEALIKAAEETIDEAIEEYNTDYTNVNAIERLNLQNEQLGTQIEIWTAQMTFFEAIINEWLAAHAPVEE